MNQWEKNTGAFFGSSVLFTGRNMLLCFFFFFFSSLLLGGVFSGLGFFGFF